MNLKDFLRNDNIEEKTIQNGNTEINEELEHKESTRIKINLNDLEELNNSDNKTVEPEPKKEISHNFQEEKTNYSNTANKKEQIDKEIKKEIKKEDVNDKINYYFEISDTKQEYKQKWIDYYNKAIKSRKDNYVIDKCRRGRFKINYDGKLEILPEINMHNKSSIDIIKSLCD